MNLYMVGRKDTLPKYLMRNLPCRNETEMRMKNISIYEAEKYQTDKYIRVKENIYKIYNDFMQQDSYVTSLSFEQEPELNEGDSSANISQYPLEDVLDKYFVAVEDFYEEINDGTSNVCVLEFISDEIEDIENLLDIVGKHVYNKEIEKGGKTYIVLKIE